jgi:hypothetical protein
MMQTMNVAITQQFQFHVFGILITSSPPVNAGPVSKIVGHHQEADAVPAALEVMIALPDGFAFTLSGQKPQVLA